MKLSFFGRGCMALFASLTLGLGMTACGGGTIGYMWVLGQTYNQVGAFKIDDYTGNLTEVPHAPFISNGAVPVSLVVKPGGRYIYVINQGTGGGPVTIGGVTTLQKGTGAGIAVYSVGGDGILTFQQMYQTQGYVSQWAQMDSTGGYLYVLDKYSSDYLTTGVGAVTVFTSDASTGRLALVQNSQTLVGGLNTNSFDVGPSPTMMKSQGGCLLTLNGDRTISPYAQGAAGQLAYVTTKFYPLTNTVHPTSITGGGSEIFITDNLTLPGGSAPSQPGVVFGFTAPGCIPTPFNVGGGGTTLQAGTVNPTYTLLDSTGKYLYVVNSTNTTTIANVPSSTISGYFINSTNQELSPLTGSPYTVGSGPVCIVEDPTNQYIYVSNFYDGTITGKRLDPTTGIISQLSRGSTFTTVGHTGCLVISGSVG